MPNQEPLQLKRGAEYWAEVEKTAKEVRAWPAWKTGMPIAPRPTASDPDPSANGDA